MHIIFARPASTAGEWPLWESCQLGRNQGGPREGRRHAADAGGGVTCQQPSSSEPMTTLVLRPYTCHSCFSEWPVCDLQTFDGIDTCGQRLCDEIRQEIARYPHLERISFIGHSMGGLLCRYAVGELEFCQHQSSGCALSESLLGCSVCPLDMFSCSLVALQAAPRDSWGAIMPDSLPGCRKALP